MEFFVTLALTLQVIFVSAFIWNIIRLGYSIFTERERRIKFTPSRRRDFGSSKNTEKTYEKTVKQVEKEYAAH